MHCIYVVSPTSLPFMTHRNLKFSRGFSLIEVIVAMGIVATVMVGLIGIMPAGVESLHDASTTTIQSRIVQELISDAQQSDWSDNPAPVGTVPNPKLSSLLGISNKRIYDAQGTLIANTGTAGTTASYATMMELDTTNSGKPVILNYAKGYSHLKKVIIYVEYTPGGRQPMFAAGMSDANRARYIKTYTILLANMGTSEGVL